MDIIFSVKYIERVFELKTIIDHTLLSLHPHMCYPVTCYDALLYRYYCSPWVTPKGFHLKEGEVVDEEEFTTVINLGFWSYGLVIFINKKDKK